MSPRQRLNKMKAKTKIMPPQVALHIAAKKATATPESSPTRDKELTFIRESSFTADCACEVTKRDLPDTVPILLYLVLGKRRNQFTLFAIFHHNPFSESSVLPWVSPSRGRAGRCRTGMARVMARSGTLRSSTG